ncbi:MAG: T9SS type A sorting domain-containing protein [Paludibacter sp.]
MKKTTLLFTFSILIGMCVYGQKPKADFDVNIKYGCYDALLSYVNKSVGAVKYFWKADDFSLRECYVPTERYYLEGKSFTTTLIAVSSDGQRDTITKNIDINALSKAIIRYNKPDSIYYAPVTIQFFNESYLRPGADSLTYYWNFGYGINLKEKNPIYEFKTSGTYNIQLVGKLNNCETSASAIVIVKDTAQRDEFKFLKSACYESINVFPVPYDFGKKYEILNDTLKIRGIYSGNCGTTKTATIRYKGDTIVIKSWEVGPLATCGCAYYFEINIPHYAKDSAIILFNGERIKSIIAAVPQVNKLDQSICIYPNPVSDNFKLETDDNSIFPLNLIVKDIEGRKIKEVFMESNNSNINTSDLKSGIYILYMYSRLGFVTKKIIKI